MPELHYKRYNPRHATITGRYLTARTPDAPQIPESSDRCFNMSPEYLLLLVRCFGVDGGYREGDITLSFTAEELMEMFPELELVDPGFAGE